MTHIIVVRLVLDNYTDANVRNQLINCQNLESRFEIVASKYAEVNAEVLKGYIFI